jgi:two-component system, NarL family, sensor histidine kinase DesK
MHLSSRLHQLLRLPWVPPERGQAPYVWVLMLAFLALKYWYAPPSAVEGLLWLATVLLFLPLYFYSYQCRGPKQGAVIAATCAFGALWSTQNPGASTFFIFAAGMCAGIVNVRTAYATLAAILAAAVLTSLTMSDSRMAFLFPALLVGTLVGAASITDARMSRSRKLLLRKQEEVEQMATIAERERISRDLHDLLGHTLSLITLKAELAGKLFERDPAACQREIGDIERSARAALSEVRSAVSGYRQTGFAHELASARASLAAAQVSLQADIAADNWPAHWPSNWPAAAENVMSLALREAVTNIVRHAGASQCQLSLAEVAGVLVLRIADNGERLADAQALRRGNGLAGMAERAAALGGELALRVERGLALEMRLPLAATATAGGGR